MALEKILKNSSGVPTGEYERIAGGTLWADLPIGAISPYGGADAPAGWMICDGTSLLRASYPELFAVIGTAFGSADSTHFNIPDMRESVPKGAGLTGHTVGAHLDADGLAVGEFLDDRFQDHTHGLTLSPNMSFLTGNGNYKTVPVSQGSTQTGVVPSAYRNGDTTEVKSVGVNYIIKAKMVALPADLASGVESIVGTLISHKHLTGGPTYSSETLASVWDIIEFSDKFCLCIGQNTVTGTLSVRGAFNLQLPSGYTFENVISANAFANGNTEWVTRASHIAGNGALAYVEAGEYIPGFLRFILIATKA